MGELKDALIYWGKIVERQNKIKFIKKSRYLQALDEFKTMANDEMQYLSQLKEKVQSEDSDIGVNFEMLKTAQAIHREELSKKIWKEDSDEAEDNDEIATKKTTKGRNTRQAKFKEIAKAN